MDTDEHGCLTRMYSGFLAFTSRRPVEPVEFEAVEFLSVNEPCEIDAAGFTAHTSLMGTLYYGDNLPILRDHIKDESVDLVYLDPPFKSDANYNAFFQGKSGASASQIKAFED